MIGMFKRFKQSKMSRVTIQVINQAKKVFENQIFALVKQCQEKHGVEVEDILLVKCSSVELGKTNKMIPKAIMVNIQNPFTQ